eukprot:TRINITY_DN6384_c0_g1_i4.p1 TRINITY_DN6384_c0_g1~~TRINITY_DN6384_c0_g1_i4.p1  ORF type:complete len:369 (-),score=55.54 TRINITY_DN6384_c0_g1_i4:156-1262(-)
MAKNKTLRKIGAKKCDSGKSDLGVKGGSVKKKEAKVVSYIHVGEGGKDDLEKYVAGKSSLTLQVYEEEILPDIDESSVINGLDQQGTATDFSDERHRCNRACPVGCQGHLRPNEITIYEGLSENGFLVERKRYRARFIMKTRNSAKTVKPPIRIPELNEEVISEVGEPMPAKYQAIIDSAEQFNDFQIQKDFGWNPTDKSFNLTMKSEDDICVRRQPVTQSTDAVRGKVGVSRGTFIYEITWPVRMRGTHASVGVAARHAPLHSNGYVPLVGANVYSWGWDIGRKEAVHNEITFRYPPTVPNHYVWSAPERFLLIMDLDEGTISFGSEGRWYGVAFSDLQGEVLFPAVSTVWGHAEISIKYLGTDRKP